MLLTDKPFSSLPNLGTPLQWFGKGEEVPLAKPGIWQVYRGVVQLSKINLKGEEVPLGWSLADSCFGILSPDLPTYQAKVLSDTYLRRFTLKEVIASAHLTQTIFTQLNQRRQQAEALLTIAGLRRIEDRLQQLLLLLKQELGEPVVGGERIVVRFTHQYLANAIGSSRVTVTRLMGEFQKRGLIAIDSDRHIIVKDKQIVLNI